MNNTDGSNKMKVLVVLVILALLAALVAAGFWRRQKQETDRLQARVTQLQEEKTDEVNQLNDRIERLEKELEAEEEEVAKPPVTPPEQPASNLFISPQGVVIQVDTPAEDSKVASPLTITGQVPGSWSFEASFPVLLKDSTGATIAQAPATLQGDWMTEELVPFTATLTFPPPGTASGFLILQKDNPSGLPENDDSIAIAVTF